LLAVGCWRYLKAGLEGFKLLEGREVPRAQAAEEAVFGGSNRIHEYKLYYKAIEASTNYKYNVFCLLYKYHIIIVLLCSSLTPGVSLPANFSNHRPYMHSVPVPTNEI